ncbi:uncharacterized protein EI97DRAFT_431674 [Westerdykella ornata]|uniref:Uncharacterized protein n=1 Tax=Westerdykella ornata TaxID=318751 RepID=A0A6A6JQD1_WESOR|nr:uncharacterized protein EI97DRAFT_431674 [Westerdykella ornata]KAF2278454.1 hypothetical protein EI97DRAFT_431674 [Westerdykella ornata]
MKWDSLGLVLQSARTRTSSQPYNEPSSAQSPKEVGRSEALRSPSYRMLGGFSLLSMEPPKPEWTSLRAIRALTARLTWFPLS